MEANELLEKLHHEGIKFPMMPSAAARVNEILSAPEPSVKDLLPVISVPSIAVRLLQVANSPALRVRRRIETMFDAVQLLGFSMVGSIVTCCTMRDMFSCQNLALARRVSSSWQHSVQVASMSVSLAKLFRLDPGKALVAGILHDVGILPIVSYLEHHIEDLDDIDESWAHLQCEVGKLVLTEWEFPEYLIEATGSSICFPEQSENVSYSDLVSAAHFLFESDPRRIQPLGIAEFEFSQLADAEERIAFMADIQ